MVIRVLNRAEYDQAIGLSLLVFSACETADFDRKGLQTFKRFIRNRESIGELAIVGAFDDDALVGVIGTKDNDAHISLFFVQPEFHRRGIGQKLFDFVYANRAEMQVTVNSSPGAVEFYKKLGFAQVADTQETDGLRYTPMRKEYNTLK